MWQRFIKFTNEYPIVRGMISYGTLWPCGCLIEQTFIEKRTLRNYDWKKCLNFSLFGAFFMGPTIYVWLRLAGVMWPRTDFVSSVSKAVMEQAAYDPMAISSFLFCMSLLEGRTYEDAKRETVNFAFVPLRNQAVFTSFFSMCWTTFLTYVKYLQIPTVDLDHHAVDIHFLEM